MKNETSVMAILAAALGALCSYASALVVPLAVLIAVMLADYASGMAKAWSAGKLCSKTGLRGILKKLGYLVLVGVAGVVDCAFVFAVIIIKNIAVLVNKCGFDSR